jgi:hypothetical protein
MRFDGELRAPKNRWCSTGSAFASSGLTFGQMLSANSIAGRWSASLEHSRTSDTEIRRLLR